MGEVARAAQAAGAATLGVIPTHLMSMEIGKRDLSTFVITETMHERKKVMFMNSDAIVVRYEDLAERPVEAGLAGGHLQLGRARDPGEPRSRRRRARGHRPAQHRLDEVGVEDVRGPAQQRRGQNVDVDAVDRHVAGRLPDHRDGVHTHGFAHGHRLLGAEPGEARRGATDLRRDHVAGRSRSLGRDRDREGCAATPWFC